MRWKTPDWLPGFSSKPIVVGDGSLCCMLKFPGGGFVVADECRFGNQAISRNGQHYGYKDSEGFVHCNVYPFGLPYEVWVNSFHDLTGQPPIVIEIPIFY